MNLSMKPKQLKPNCDGLFVSAWFYEERRGLEIVVEIDGLGNKQYIHIPITWKTILASVRRYQRPNK